MELKSASRQWSRKRQGVAFDDALTPCIHVPRTLTNSAPSENSLPRDSASLAFSASANASMRSRGWSNLAIGTGSRRSTRRYSTHLVRSVSLVGQGRLEQTRRTSRPRTTRRARSTARRAQEIAESVFHRKHEGKRLERYRMSLRYLRVGLVIWPSPDKSRFGAT